LLHAALAGLLSLGSVACGDKEKADKNEENAPVTTMTQTPNSKITSEKVDKSITLTSFLDLCKSRTGLVQTHANCSGNNSCKGVSFHSESGKLSEHTCSGANICAGISCVELPKDSGFTGAEILQGTKGDAVQCNFCHGPGKDSFNLPVKTGTATSDADKKARTDEFTGRSKERLVSEIAFGIHGVNENGTAFANMPGYYTKYSRAEIERVVDFLRTLPVKVEEWKTLK
jgi:mono/diheme cytochrome c family protein